MRINDPLVSIVVLNWNGKCFLSNCIDSLLTQDYPNYEVLLVDNGSSDGSLEFAQTRFGDNPKVRIIALGYNYGFSRGNNLGIKYAQGKYVIVLNNDTEVMPSFVAELVKVAEADETIGSVSCKILHYDGSVWFGQYFTHAGFIVPFFTQSLLKETLTELYDHFSLNLANSGCAVLYRKELISKIEGFDEDFWSDWEDYDLGYRINLAGFKSVYIPIPLVLHVGGGSFGFPPERLVRMYRNMLLTYVKNYELRNFVTRFPLFLFVLLPICHVGWLVHRLCFSLRAFDKRNGIWYFFSLMKAYIQFISKLKIFYAKRYKIMNLRKVSDKQIFLNTQLIGVL
ncbi:MAG TPA: glycosyltransferase family 2 protein [Candidatus Bathyarchaeia archaeon]|nr:glycosyltransferase family 2 protein [Candidatus Bathyarchaeia archaeon]